MNKSEKKSRIQRQLKVQLLATELLNLKRMLPAIVFTAQYLQTGYAQAIGILSAHVLSLLRGQVNGLALAQQNRAGLTFKLRAATGAMFALMLYR